jgi:predicted HNH restriction endonuclease
MINSGKEWDFMEEEVQIEEILTEANAYNLRQEVITTAEVFMKDDPDLNKAVAYEMAYMEWVK